MQFANEKGVKSLKILVIGAGVLGSYLTHSLCKGENEVTLVARGNRKAELEEKGLVIEHKLKKQTTVDRPIIVEKVEAQEEYDAAFIAMQFGQMKNMLKLAAEINTDCLVLVGNNMDALGMEKQIQSYSQNPKTVFFGFQSTGGRREDGKVISVSMSKSGAMTIGLAKGEPDERQKKKLQEIFAPIGYELKWNNNMDVWLKCHMAFILPVAFVCYATDCDLRKSNRTQRRMILDAALEANELLKSLGYEVPKEEWESYRPGVKRKLTAAMLFIMAKTVIGDLAAADHCKNAREEMKLINDSFEELKKRNPKMSMANWDKLKNATYMK